MRRISAEARITYVWIALSALTILGWALTHVRSAHDLRPSGPETAAVLVIAGVKVRLIIREYMEVRTAPHWLRITMDAWLVTLLAIVAGLYALA